jgi:glucan biosynthesis protein
MDEFLVFLGASYFRTIPAKLSAIAAFLKSSKYAPTEVAELAALQTRA